MIPSSMHYRTNAEIFVVLSPTNEKICSRMDAPFTPTTPTLCFRVSPMCFGLHFLSISTVPNFISMLKTTLSTNDFFYELCCGIGKY